MLLSILAMICVVQHVYSYEPIKVYVEELAKEGINRVFTDGELAEYDGTEEGKHIYMSVKGVVFDVTPGKDFYAKGGNYHSMAGKDVSRAMATQNLEEKDYVSDLTGLSDKELETMDSMFQHVYLRKYKIVGLMQYVVDKYNAGKGKDGKNEL